MLKTILKFKTAKELEQKIDEYFSACQEEAEPVTITGLALALNISREALRDYDEKDAYFEIVKKAKLRVQHEYEKRLIKRGNTGDVFALKNFGWSDKAEIEKTLKIQTALVEFEGEDKDFEAQEET